MPSTVIRKIPLFASRVVKQPTHNLSSDTNAAIIYPNAVNSINVANKNDGYVELNANGTTNQLKNMFDNFYNTSYRISAQSIINATEGAQLILDFGRQIKPRQVKITFADNENWANFKLYFSNNLGVQEAEIVNDDNDFGAQIGQVTGLGAQATLDTTQNTDPDGVFELTDFEGSLAVNVGGNPDGTVTSDLFQCSINEEHFTTGEFDNFRYAVFVLSNPGGTGTPDFVDIALIEVFEEFDNRDFSVEFDDALFSQKGWINPRYEGSKITIKELNKFTPRLESDIGIPSIGPNPDPTNDAQVGINFVVGTGVIYPGDTVGPYGQIAMLSTRTIALYYATTVIGGDESPNLAKIKNHSYIKIAKILLINKEDQTITIIDRDTQGGGLGSDTDSNFNSYHRFITEDFPTGGKLNMKILDNSVQSNLKTTYHCKMNKGNLLKSFNFTFVPPPSNFTIINNTMYFYRGGSLLKNKTVDGYAVQNHPFGTFSGTGTIDFSLNDSGNPTESIQRGLRFRYAQNESGFPVASNLATFQHLKGGPQFASSSIVENEFTSQYYSGSFGFIIDNEHNNTFTPDINYARSGIGSASRFIGIDTLNFLQENKANTELHITFFDGTKDFAPGFNDERSISTFEVSPGQQSLELGDICNNNLPKTHEFFIKGIGDSRFEPATSVVNMDLFNSHMATLYAADGTQTDGCDTTNPPVASQDSLNNMEVFVQGGVDGFEGAASFNSSTPANVTADNAYSGSFNYQLSFLQKDHTLIVDLNKELETPEGVGDNGIILIPENLDHEIRNNLDFYIQQISNLLQLGDGSDDAINYT